MIEITVKLQLDENSSDAKRALSALFGLPNASSCYSPVISTEGPAPKPEVKAEEAKPAPQPEVKAEEAKPAPQPEPEKAQQKVEGPKPAAAAKKSYKTEDVRAAMASKLADHRVDLVNKLKDMGAKNVSSLPEDKYEEFINFCNSL